MTRLLLLRHSLRNRDEDIYCQEPNAVLIIRCQVLEKRDHLLNHNRWGHGFDKLCQVVRRLSPNHRGIIVYELAVVLPKQFLRGRRSSGVGDVVQSSCGDLRRKPVCFRQAHNKGNEELLYLGL